MLCLFIFSGKNSCMTTLSRDALEKEIRENRLVEGFERLESQLTANGIDFRIAGLIEVARGGVLPVDKSRSVPPALGNAWVLPGFEDALNGLAVRKIEVLGAGTPVALKKLVPYLALSCETVNTPEKYTFKIEARSSLFRLAQCVLETAFGEAGYRGRLTFLLFSLLDSKIELGARFAQVSFSTLEGTSHYEKQRETSYQGGKIL